MKDMYVYRWGFVWRVKRPKLETRHKDISGWSDYKTYCKFFPGQIIDCDDVLDYVSLSTAPMFIRKRA